MNTDIVRKPRAAALSEGLGSRLVRPLWFLLPLLAAAAIFASAAGAATTTGSERRVALVIGNSTYQSAPHLPNPASDAEALAGTLQRLGFEVLKGIDLDRAETEMIIREFAKNLSGADVALFFYAGHGIQVGERNYLIPVDAELDDETDLDFEATALDLVLRHMEREPRVNLVFLDACRNNPLAQNLTRSMGSTRGLAIGRGLAVVQAQVGSFIAYATQPQNVAVDGTGKHSPFAAALLKYMETSGLSLADLMIKVRNDVREATQGKQVPWDHSSLTGAFYFQPAVATIETVEPAASAPAVQVANTDVVFWESIKDSDDPAQFQAYLAKFPDGTFAELAQLRIAKLTAKPADTSRSGEQVATVTPPDATVPAAEEVERSIGLTKQGRSRAQLALTLLGYSTGGTDGVLGARSRAAISAWQSDSGETATGYLTAKQHAALLDAAAPKLAAWDAEQKKKAAEAKQAAAAKAKQQQQQQQQQATQPQYTTSKQIQDAEAQKVAAAQAEAERLRQENEALKKQQEEAQTREDVSIGVGLFGAAVGGAIPFLNQ